jgi:hypothetical protein
MPYVLVVGDAVAGKGDGCTMQTFGVLPPSLVEFLELQATSQDPYMPRWVPPPLKPPPCTS